ncbi:hypothetical protein [Demetria terragena]|uniref:hypothetical protein n=1 Tax=Demetria terragena TaxID=63959 RepID=UPI00037238BA|nr:hypothetical protein [Demetria terragena]
MMLALLVLFGVLLIASTFMVIIARRGLATTDDGYDAVPDHVRSDPELARRANAAIGRHGLYGVILSLAPVLYATWMLTFEMSRHVPTEVLAAAAALGALAVIVLRLPFERMKHW